MQAHADGVPGTDPYTLVGESYVNGVIKGELLDKISLQWIESI